jgi:GntR family transcriptional regulator, transcriptional repressor for pyruvate dehydrogenase complex
MDAVDTARPPLSERLFADLLEALLSGRYAPGERLPPQRALAADAGVTMTALREALKRLEQMGLIDVRHGAAMRVRDWRRHGGLDVIAHLLLSSGSLDRGVLADVLEARTLMLGELAALAAQRRTSAQSERLAALAGEIGRAGDDANAQRLDFAFFEELAEAAGNLVFVLILNSIRELYFQHAERLAVTARHRELAPLYGAAARAVSARDRGGARHAVTALAGLQRRRVEDALT